MSSFDALIQDLVIANRILAKKEIVAPTAMSASAILTSPTVSLSPARLPRSW